MSLLRWFSILAVVCGFVSPARAQGRRTEYYRGQRVAAQEIIVKFRGTDRARGLAAVARDPDIAQSESLGRTGALRLRSRGRSAAALIQEYAKRSDVEYAEPNYLWHASEVPNDLFIGDQWGLRNTGQFFDQNGIPGADIKAVEAWNITEGSRGIVVGVIDSGIDYNHPDLAANIWSAPSDFQVTVSGQTITCAAGTHGFDAITRTCNPVDNDGHGTHVSGIIAGVGNNAIGISGVSRVGSIVALKFLDTNGTGSTTDAIAAIEFAVEVKRVFGVAANVRILNASWGSHGNFSQTLLDAINLAGQNDMLFVAAAGNEGQDNDFNPHYPAGYNAPSIVSVAAVDNRGELIAFSNIGRNSIDLAAPGANIVSTLPPGTNNLNPYGAKTGTSMSAPHVSGAAALVLSACPASTANLKAHLLSSVDVLPSLVGATVSGGRVNVYRAITDCFGAVPESFAVTASPGLRTMGFLSTTEYTVSTGISGSFASAITLAVSNPPSGMTWSFNPPVVNPGQSSVLTVEVDATVPQGTYTLKIVGTAGTATRTAEILTTVGLPLSPCGVAIGQPPGTGRLESTDIASIHRASALADYCQLTIDAERPVKIDVDPSGFSSEVYLMSSSGTILRGGVTSDFEIVLQAGVYFLEITTRQAARFNTFGTYKVTTSLVPPSAVSIKPQSLSPGTDVNVEILGNNFYGPPFTAEVTSCQTGSVTVSNVSLILPTVATATFHVSSTALGTCNLRVTAATGTVNGSFTVLPPPPVLQGFSPSAGSPGDVVFVTIGGSNFKPQMTVVPIAGITVSNMVVVSSTLATATFSIPANASGTQLAVRTTNNDGTLSNPATFEIKAGLPVLNSITPAFAPVGGKVAVELKGRNLGGNRIPIINAGEGITTRLRAAGNLELIFDFEISPFAVPGMRALTVTTDVGTSNSLPFMVFLPPVLTGISPARGIQGVNTTATISGVDLNWGGCQFISSPPDPGFLMDPHACEVTSVAVTFQIARTAIVGDHMLTITNAAGTSNPVIFTVDPRGATLNTISPAILPRGKTVQVTLNGFDFVTPLSINVEGGGIAVSNVVSTASSVTATFAVDASATIGKRVLTVTTPVGQSNPIEFTVTPADYVDLVPSQSQSRPFAMGQNETYSLVIRNTGLGPTTGPITVTDEIPSGLEFVSGVGQGWVCVQAPPTINGPTARCTASSPIAPGEQSTIALTVRVNGLSPIQQRLNVVKVDYAGDFFPANNSTSMPTQAFFIPAVSVLVSSNPLTPGQQSTVRVVMAEPYPYDLVGTLDATFDRQPVDPAMQFATGGRSASFTVPANTVEAVFSGNTGPLGFQPGTMFGEVRLTAAVKPPGFIVFVTSKTLPVSVPLAAPNIAKVEPETSSTGFTLKIVGLTTGRTIQKVTFRFDTNPTVRLVCTNTLTCTVNGANLTFDVTSIADSWFIFHPEFGSLFTLRFPFTIQGTISGSIVVTLANGVGTSNAITLPIPQMN